MKTSVRMLNTSRCLTVIWCFFLFPQALPLGAWGFLLSLNHDCFACQLQRAELLRRGSHEGPFFRIFPLSLQSIISNQMRPRRVRGAWFSRLSRHPASWRIGSILSPGINTGSHHWLVLLDTKELRTAYLSTSTTSSLSSVHRSFGQQMRINVFGSSRTLLRADARSLIDWTKDTEADMKWRLSRLLVDKNFLSQWDMTPSDSFKESTKINK